METYMLTLTFTCDKCDENWTYQTADDYIDLNEIQFCGKCQLYFQKPEPKQPDKPFHLTHKLPDGVTALELNEPGQLHNLLYKMLGD